MIGGVAVREAPDTMFFVPSTNSSNNSSEFDLVACENRRVQVAVVLTTLVGIIQVSLETFSSDSLSLRLFIQHSRC